MPNEHVNKVIKDGTTLIDLTGDTATAADVIQGKSFHLASGEQVQGTLPTSHTHDASDIVSGTLSVERGGTGSGTQTTNSVLTGNGTSAIGHVSTASGALYATSSGGVAAFGTLPVAQGGTGATTAAAARTNLDAAQSDGAAGTLKAAEDAIGNLASSIAGVEQTTATANHANGSYFMLGNVLMCATAAIATGEQITSSNATPATVQAQIDNIRRSVLRAVSGVTVNGVGYITGDDQLVTFVPLPNADQYTTITVTPVNARGTSGMVFNSANLPTAYRIQHKSALGCEVVFTQASPSSGNRYKVVATEMLISAS